MPNIKRIVGGGKGGEEPKQTYEKNLGYISYVFGQKSYNGVAIISKNELNNINLNFIKDDLKQSRIITAELKFRKKN